MRSAYGRSNGHRDPVQRIVVLMPKEEVEKVDAWAIPQGFESRAAAIRAILKRGLEALKNEPKTA